MDLVTFLAFVDRLPPEEQAALYSNPEAVRDLARRLAAAAGSVFTRQLDYTGGPGLIGRLVAKGGPWGYQNPVINDAGFPVSGEGIVNVRFRILRGTDLKRADGYVYRDDVDASFGKERMRRPNAAEALVVPAEDHEIGRGEHPLVAFISGSPHAFIVHEYDRGRYLNLYSGDDHWDPDYAFLGVCE